MSKKNKGNPFPPCTIGLLNNIRKEPIAADQPGYDISFFLGSEHIDKRKPPIAPYGNHPHTNHDTGEVLPNCCSFHKEVYEEASAWLEVFPDCCKIHKEGLAQHRDFIKDHYSTMPEKIVLWLLQTEHVISKTIDHKDWYNLITGYIDHCFLWFNMYYVGLNIYLNNLHRFIITQSGSFITPDKTQKLCNYIDRVGKYYKYALCFGFIPKLLQDWQKTFLYEVNYINSMQITFSPILNPLPYDIQKKKFVYSALTYEYFEKESMDELISQSKTVLKKINAFELYKRGLLTEPEKAKLEVLVKKREFELERKYDQINFLSKQPEYVGLFQEWFNDEKEFINEIAPLIRTLPYENIKSKSSPSSENKDLVICLISFTSEEILKNVFELLKGYFPANENNLKTALEGQQLEEPIVFPYSQNKLVEVFRRLKYNGYIPNKTSEVRDWLCANFHFRFKRGQIDEIRSLNPDSVWDILSKGRGEPTKRERICFENVGWLPYKSPLQLSRESESEQL